MYDLQAQLNPWIFREYDIRGVVDKHITVPIARLLGKGIGTFLRQRTSGNRLAVGRDNRPSSEDLKNALVEGLLASGCDVVDIGLSTSPLLYIAVLEWGLDGGINVTASHNPKEDNGFKMVGRAAYPVASTDIAELRELVMSGQFYTGTGSLTLRDLKQRYFEKIGGLIQLKRPMKVAIDTGNGVAGLFVPAMLRRLGCEVIELHCDLDGTFPHHLPNPEREANVLDLEEVVVNERADVGFGIDGDGDRLAMIDERGTFRGGDYALILLSRAFLSKHPGERVLMDVKMSKNVEDDIRKHGGVPVMWKTGHSLIKKKMREDGILLGGELSGHMFVFEDYYPVDDALFATATIVKILSESSVPLSQHFEDLPRLYSTELIELPIADTVKHETVRELAKIFSSMYKVNDIDGARITFPDGWALVRASNTTPNLTVRFEAESPEGLERIQKVVYDVLKRFDAIRIES